MALTPSCPVLLTGLHTHCCSEVLFWDFAESQSKDFKEAIDEEESTEDYGYSSDSDLEDAERAKVAAKPRIHPLDPHGTL